MKEIEDILKKQLSKLYADNKIDKTEAIMKTDLQELFNLSYDQFLEIVNDIAIEAIERGADYKDLDTVF